MSGSPVGILSQRIGGRYVMDFGDTDIWMATSADLIHWLKQAGRSWRQLEPGAVITTTCVVERDGE
ncbi:MAG: hypothetical protein HY319_15315 [Armatimonadetes bacterium]|nr:hypothetical protein [Armatimonadota bacterium]